MTDSPVQAWISRQLRHDPPRAKSLVMTVFGDAIVPRGGAVWLGSLIALLEPLGINERAVRTSVFRLVDEGWLAASRSGRRSQYRLSAQGEQRFLRAHQRVYAPPSPDWSGRWTLLLTPSDRLSAARRNALKKELLWEGFAPLSPGSYAYPGEKNAALTEILERTRSVGEVVLLSAADTGIAGALPLAQFARHHWPLKEVSTSYRRFLRRFQPLLPLTAQPDHHPALAFAARILLIHAYRRVQLHDPQLPQALLGDDWPGTTAYALCQAIYRQIVSASDRHIAAVLHQEQATVPSVRAEFRQRFTGPMHRPR